MKLRANQLLTKYLSQNGFRKVNVDSEKRYYVHESGRQVRIDFNNQFIALINRYGQVLDEQRQFDEQAFEEFLYKESSNLPLKKTGA